MQCISSGIPLAGASPALSARSQARFSWGNLDPTRRDGVRSPDTNLDSDFSAFLFFGIEIQDEGCRRRRGSGGAGCLQDLRPLQGATTHVCIILGIPWPGHVPRLQLFVRRTFSASTSISRAATAPATFILISIEIFRLSEISVSRSGRRLLTPSRRKRSTSTPKKSA